MAVKWIILCIIFNGISGWPIPKTVKSSRFFLPFFKSQSTTVVNQYTFTNQLTPLTPFPQQTILTTTTANISKPIPSENTFTALSSKVSSYIETLSKYEFAHRIFNVIISISLLTFILFSVFKCILSRPRRRRIANQSTSLHSISDESDTLHSANLHHRRTQPF